MKKKAKQLYFLPQMAASGIVAIADTVKDSAGEMTEQLKKCDTEAYMITGDNLRTANAIANFCRSTAGR